MIYGFLSISTLIITITLFSVPVQGGWSEWTPTVDCTSRCIDGIEKFARNCSRPSPKFGGEDCIGNSSKTVSCGSNICGKLFVLYGICAICHDIR